MMLELKLRKIGNSVGVVLPKEALAHLKAEEGDVITLAETPEGYRMAPSQSDFAKTMAVMASLSQRYKNTLRELAK
jgi:putative addiction module antidote